MKPGDLIRFGGLSGSPDFPGVLGVLLRKLQYDTDDDEAQNWDGMAAWWVQFMNDPGPTWSYEEELTLVKKGN
jgi:hypothetical protein